MTMTELLYRLEQKNLEVLSTKEPLIIFGEGSWLDLPTFHLVVSYLSTIEFSLVVLGDKSIKSQIYGGQVFSFVSQMKNIPLAKFETSVDAYLNMLSGLTSNETERGQYAFSKWNGEKQGAYSVVSDPDSFLDRLAQIKALVPGSQVICIDDTYSRNRLNSYLQGRMNPLEKDSDAIKVRSNILRVGDPILISRGSNMMSLPSGSTGKLTAISKDPKGQVKVSIDIGGELHPRKFNSDQLCELNIEPGYVIDVSKVYGKKFDEVVFCCFSSQISPSKTDLYTAITSALNLFIFLGPKQLIASNEYQTK